MNRKSSILPLALFVVATLALVFALSESGTGTSMAQISVIPTWTSTPTPMEPPTSTPTNTPVPPTFTPTPVSPTVTFTPLPPTSTPMPLPPTPTPTPLPPTPTPANLPPRVILDYDLVTVDEGDWALNGGSVVDPDGRVVGLLASVGDVTLKDNALSWTYRAADGPDDKAVIIRAIDDGGATGFDTFRVQVSNVAPVVGSIAGPTAPVRVDDMPITFRVYFTEPLEADIHTATIEYGDGTSCNTDRGLDCSLDEGTGGVGSVMASHTYAQPGTYSIALSVTDDDGGTGTSTLEVEVVQGSDTVVLKLLDSSGNGLSGGTANYYDGGWQDIPGRTDADGTLVTDIPATRRYRFRMRYARAWVDKTQDVSADPTVVFQTTNVTTELRDSNGNLFDTGTVRYYAPGWRSFGTTTGGEVSKELLPRHYRFRMHYAGAWVDKTQDVGADPTVVFQTGQVHSVSGTATHYHARRWRPFTNDMQLLPKIYRFRYADRSRKKFAISAGTTTNID